MPTIKDVPDDAHTKVQLLANAWNVSDGEAVARLVEHFARSPARAQPPAETRDDDRIRIHAIYDATRIEAVYDPTTKAVTITSGKLVGKTYSTPSGAAVAVVTTYNPSVNPNRNGWSFWILTDNGELLQSIR
ncbi:hypothetical protein AB0J72_33315 [Dactylosporangium sp. NPDC049742]|uniref:hypothetical protein n=1 Tax=Dactylosporangium sp. NPDC049742 TaxID=3154737 RepID=UPI003434E04B